MARALNFACEEHVDPFECPDALVIRTSSGGVGLIVHDGGSSSIEISHCPWCGSQVRGGTAQAVLLVQHERRGASDADVKVIGVYSARANAEAVTTRLAAQPGFRDHPDGFSIEAYELDSDHWTEGFGV